MFNLMALLIAVFIIVLGIACFTSYKEEKPRHKYTKRTKKTKKINRRRQK